MTENEWLNSTELPPMLEHLGDRLTARKLRLFACALARRVWKLLDDEQCKVAGEMAERFADGLASPAALAQAYQAANSTWASIPVYAGSRRAMRRSAKNREAEKHAAWMARRAANPELRITHIRHPSWESARKKVSQADLLRELFGPLPFRAIVIEPTWLAWNGGAAVGLAETVQEDGTFDLLPVLGDALEDAGCADAALLDHLRGTGPHVRGCWALDLILGKSPA